MVLVDRDIKKLAEDPHFLESYDEKCVTNIGYDLRAKYFVIGKKKRKSAYLQPGESAVAASVDVINVPENLLCRVALKNSRIRQGFTMDAPVYQPGHKTRIFFRLTNISGDELRLSEGESYAMLIFEQLSSAPDHPYDGAFSDEITYSGLGKYQGIYQNQGQGSRNVKEASRKKTAWALAIFCFGSLTANILHGIKQLPDN